jgi:Uma2 family endonuclease
MVRALPDDGLRYETVHGELLVTRAPAPPHRRVAARLHAALGRYLDGRGLGRVLAAPAGLAPGPDTLVQPEVFVVPDRAAVHRPVALLVAEVVSPATGRADRFCKRRLYQELGIPLYWVVDPAARAVEVWAPGALLPVVEYGWLRWRPGAAPDSFVHPVAGLWDEG